MSSLINLSGLGMAIGCCLVVFAFLDWFVNQNVFLSKLCKLYVIERVGEKDGHPQFLSETPAPLGSFLKKDFPQIVNMCRLDYTDGLIKEEALRFSMSYSNLIKIVKL